MSKFPCSGCGGCCMMAGGKLGMPDRGDGACLFLDYDNTCSIYEQRPLICRVDELYDHVKPDMTRGEWHGFRIQACNIIIDKLGLDNKYKIPEH